MAIMVINGILLKYIWTFHQPKFIRYGQNIANILCFGGVGTPIEVSKVTLSLHLTRSLVRRARIWTRKSRHFSFDQKLSIAIPSIEVLLNVMLVFFGINWSYTQAYDGFEEK